MPDEVFSAMGLGRRDDRRVCCIRQNGTTAIPNGYLAADIDDPVEAFEHGSTDDDRRGGMLAYGFIR